MQLPPIRAPTALNKRNRKRNKITKSKKGDVRQFADIQSLRRLSLGVFSDFRPKVQNNREKICLT
ncbi:hypothetical protein FACS1894219_00120 [Clostridia bacterium]|nr:hypothetical protein FACS1894219_00120 [Clostridia bacterium]